MPKKVFVGLSGGVDSSVAAALLKKEGHSVIGVFIKVWSPNFLPCTWPEERRSAIAVAATLNIPFVTLDLEEEYKRHVVDYMIEEYRRGRTPNPDVMCNQHIKFGGFLEYAVKSGGDFIATGHYARRKQNRTSGQYELHEGIDEGKDQSYFLWTMEKDNLPKVLFPIGEFKKKKVRVLAKEFNLPTADKKDSQGLCFLGKVDMREFLKNYIDEQKGNVLNEAGQVIGTHEGSMFYTIGQRHGFLITEANTKRKRRFVVAKNLENNTITVSEEKEHSKYNPKKIALSNENWINGERPEIGNYEGRIRYRGKRERCYIDYINNVLIVRFKNAQLGLANGQSLVVYERSNCLGGGIIEQAYE